MKNQLGGEGSSPDCHLGGELAEALQLCFSFMFDNEGGRLSVITEVSSASEGPWFQEHRAGKALVPYTYNSSRKICRCFELQTRSLV